MRRHTAPRGGASSSPPPPPIMMGTCGPIHWGDVEEALRVEHAALEVLLGAALALPHGVGDPEGVLEHLEARGRAPARGFLPETFGLGLVPGRADAKPGPTAGEDVERRRGLDQQPRVPVVDAADQEPQAGLLAMGGHEAERGPALEHRLELGTRPPDLPEVVHHPDRVEAHIVGGPNGPGECRPDGLWSAGPGERRRSAVRASRRGPFRAAPGGGGPIEGLDLGGGE